MSVGGSNLFWEPGKRPFWTLSVPDVLLRDPAASASRLPHKLAGFPALQRGSRFLPWCNSKSDRYLYAFSSMHYLYCMDCQICLRRLERFEPVYRMHFGPEIYNGWRTSVCSRCLSAFVESLKRPGLRDRFRSPKPCELCARPVYNLKRRTVTRVICSPRCRGIIDTERANQRGRSRSFGFLA